MSNISLDFHSDRGAVSVPPLGRRRQGRIHPIVNTQITKTVTNLFLLVCFPRMHHNISA